MILLSSQGSRARTVRTVRTAVLLVEISSERPSAISGTPTGNGIGAVTAPIRNKTMPAILISARIIGLAVKLPPVQTSRRRNLPGTRPLDPGHDKGQGVFRFRRSPSMAATSPEDTATWA